MKSEVPGIAVVTGAASGICLSRFVRLIFDLSADIVQVLAEPFPWLSLRLAALVSPCSISILLVWRTLRLASRVCSSLPACKIFRLSAFNAMSRSLTPSSRRTLQSKANLDASTTQFTVLVSSRLVHLRPLPRSKTLTDKVSSITVVYGCVQGKQSGSCRSRVLTVKRTQMHASSLLARKEVQW